MLTVPAVRGGKGTTRESAHSLLLVVGVHSFLIRQEPDEDGFRKVRVRVTSERDGRTCGQGRARPVNRREKTGGMAMQYALLVLLCGCRLDVVACVRVLPRRQGRRAAVRCRVREERV